LAERDRISMLERPFRNPERRALEHAPSSSRYAARTMSHHCYDDPGGPPVPCAPGPCLL